MAAVYNFGNGQTALEARGPASLPIGHFMVPNLAKAQQHRNLRLFQTASLPDFAERLSLVLATFDSGEPVSAQLPDGLYPFANVRLPLSQMAMMEAPRALERLLKEAALAAGVEIRRDEPVELSCTSDAWPDATFLVFWPSGEKHINILAPLSAVTGRA